MANSNNSPLEVFPISKNNHADALSWFHSKVPEKRLTGQPRSAAIPEPINCGQEGGSEHGSSPPKQVDGRRKGQVLEDKPIDVHYASSFCGM